MANSKLRIWSIVSLIVLSLTIFYHLVVILQVKFQMVGDFIPKNIFWEITSLNFIIIAVVILIELVAWLLHKKKNYIVVIVMGAITALCQQIYLFLN